MSFYQIILTSDKYDEKTENMVFDFIINNTSGIYYIYDRQIAFLPNSFASKQASQYIGAIEILSLYKRNTSKLDFVIEWLNSNRNENGNWDMGTTVNDKVYFPLPDSWRKKTYREKDCTFRIQNLVRSLSEAKEDRM